MFWPGALQKKAIHSRLELQGREVRPVTVYTHMFVLGDASGRADEREHLHYTATGTTAEEAETAAYAVYRQAAQCQHDLDRVSPELLRCRHCQVQRRTPPTHQSRADQGHKGKPQRRLFGLWRGH